MKLRSLDVALAALAVVAALAACGGKEAPPPAAAGEDAVLEKIQIRRPEDSRIVATFRLTAEHVTIRFDDDGRDRVLRSRRDGDVKQRRYNERGAGAVALARPNPEAHTLTVRQPKGELRWRVRLGKNRILVEDHPELPAFELRQPNDSTVRVRYEEGAELGRVVFGRGNGVTLVRGPEGDVRYQIRSQRRSAIYGVLLVPDLDPVERYVLMAELLIQDE